MGWLNYKFCIRYCVKAKYIKMSSNIVVFFAIIGDNHSRVKTSDHWFWDYDEEYHLTKNMVATLEIYNNYLIDYQENQRQMLNAILE